MTDLTGCGGRTDDAGGVELDNGVLRVRVARAGAELASIVRNDTGIEYLWSGDPAFWPRRAPVLFPIVGRLRGDAFSHGGTRYRLPQHGFARDRRFEIAETCSHADPGRAATAHSGAPATPTGQDAILPDPVAHPARVPESTEHPAIGHAATSCAATFAFIDDDATRAAYPFPFRLEVGYLLDGDWLRVSFAVCNPGEALLPFSLGGHPGFRCPLVPGECFTDSVIEFEHAETVDRWPVVDGLIGRPAIPALRGQATIDLTPDLFCDGALVFTDLHSRRVRLAGPKGGRGVEMEFDGFPSFGIWSKPGAPFVCLEPWCGIADSVDASGRLEDKPGLIWLPPGEGWRRSFAVRPF